MMPLYDWECAHCGRKWEGFGKMIETQKLCVCGEFGDRKFSPPVACHVWKPVYFDQFGPEPILVESKAHLKRLCKEKGVEAVCLM